MRNKTVFAPIIPSVVLLALLAVGCGSGHKEGQEVPVASPTAEGNLQSRILSVSVPPAGTPVVTFTLFDEIGAPLDPASVVAGGGRVRFTIARIKADGNYENYIPSNDPVPVPAFDVGTPSAGQFATVGTGTYTYTFRTDIDNAAQTLGGIVLDNNSRNLTHTVAAQIQRNALNGVGKSFQEAVNPYLNFVPSGAAVTVTREVVAMSDCNECHFKYGAHGGGRRDVALCILCHNPGPLDELTGNPLDMKDLIHKIHYGENLPGNVAGGAYSIGTSGFADVTFPFMSGDSKIAGTPIECTKCHRAGFDTSGRPYGKDVAKYKQNPTARKCTTCHNTTTFNGENTIQVTRLNADDTVDNVTVPAINHAGAGFAGFPINVTGDNADVGVICSACHAQPGVAPPYTIGSVDATHTIAEKSPVIFPGINFQIVSVSNAVAGQAPAVRFRITTDNGAVIAPSTANASFNVKLGYPASDYNNIGNTPSQNTQGQPFSKSLAAATANGDGSYTATFDNTIPASASGVGVIGLEGRATYFLTGFRAPDNVRIGGQSVQYYFDMGTGAQVTDPSRQRRKVVDVAKCKLCHSRLSKHGANRVNSIEECVICHNPAAFSMNNEDNSLSATIDFKVFIHQIHTGEDLDPSVIVFDNTNAGVTYPQDRKNCLACHVDATTPTFGIPLPAGVQGTSTSWGLDNTTNADDPKTPPIQAVCTACHFSSDTIAFTAQHVADQTSGTIELCAQCHTTGLLLGPDFAHQPIRPFPVD